MIKLDLDWYCRRFRFYSEKISKQKQQATMMQNLREADSPTTSPHDDDIQCRPEHTEPEENTPRVGRTKSI